MINYVEIEIDVFGKDGNTYPQTINICNINYYRPFVETNDKSGGKDSLKTMVYFMGSVKATHISCSYYDFKRKLQEAKDKLLKNNLEQP